MITIEGRVEAPPLSLARLREMMIQALNVRVAFRLVRRVRLEVREMAAQCAALTVVNARLEEQIEALRLEKDDLKIALDQYQVVDPNAKCPFCGATDGKIKTEQSVDQQRAYVAHTCNVCSGTWPEDPILIDAGKLWKADVRGPKN